MDQYNDYDSVMPTEEQDNEEEMLPEEEELPMKSDKWLIFEPPAQQPISIGKIVVDGFGFWKKIPAEDGTETSVTKPQYFPKDIVRRFTLVNDNNVTVQIINYGATITRIAYPDSEGRLEDVVMGYDTFEEYLSDENPKLGSTLGRYSSILSDASVNVNREDYTLTMNQDGDHVMGGNVGFDKVLWEASVINGKVVMSYTSPDEEEGYPGTLMVQLTFHLSQDNTLHVTTSATASKATPISIANNIYFNLAGHGSGKTGLNDHCIMINADRWLMTDNGKITGEAQSVGGSYYDLRVPRSMEKALSRVPGKGYDTTYCLTKGDSRNSVTFAARLAHPPSGRFLEIHTNQPSLQVYTANALPNLQRTADFSKDKFSGDDKLGFLCRDRKEEGDHIWPVTQDGKWPRPESIPSEEHIFKRYSELSMTKSGTSGEKSGPMAGVSISMVNHPGSYGFVGNENEEEEMYGVDLIEAESENEEDEIDVWVPPKPILGKRGCEYTYQGAISLVTQEYPDAFKFNKHPRPIAYPGKIYTRTTMYRFGQLQRRVEPLSEKALQFYQVA